DIAGQISGSGSMTVNAGATTNLLTLDLHHANAYTGGTKVTDGILDVFADGALGPGGTNDAGTSVAPNGLLFLHGVAYNTPETLTLDGTLENDGGNSSFAGPITITGASSGTGNGLPVPVDAQINDGTGGNFTLNGPTLVNSGHADLFIEGNNLALGGSAIVAIDNTISGPGGLLVESATLKLQAANTYQGSTFLGGIAEVDVGGDNAVPSTSAVMMQAAANANTVHLGGHTDTIGSLSGTESSGGTNTFDLGTSGALTAGGDNTSTAFAGDITGSGTLTKLGRGTFDLISTNDFTGATSVQSGSLLIDGSTAAGNAITVHGTAVMGGAGTIGGAVTVAGTLSPGAGPDPSKDIATLTVNGTVTFEPNDAVESPISVPSVFAVQLGTAATPANDQLDSKGTVSLNSVTLDLTTLPGAGPFAAGQQFVILQAGAPLTTTFHNLPEGSTISDGTQNFTISYANDRVTLTAQPLTQGNQTATYLNGQAGDITAGTFVHNLYRELLGREPEPAGQTFWVSAFFAVDTGGTHAAQAQQAVVAAFLATSEYRSHLVTGIYRDFLHRDPEAQGLQFWTSLLAGGADEKSVLAGVVGSDEYFAKAGGTAQGFVNTLYRDLLGRPGDPQGLEFWTNFFTSPPPFFPQTSSSAGFRTVLVEAFLGMPEAEHKALNGNFPGAAGSVGAPGTPAVGAYGLADITGNGWDNLYFEGNLSTAAVDSLFAGLQAGASYDGTIAAMLEMAQYLDGTVVPT
ncbi:MAG TPA: DUF4214 domain-containing protein, partial [Pirellulales bacterium]|nr:DUF4214 domain-containing protein [Pirellulales bacterium]